MTKFVTALRLRRAAGIGSRRVDESGQDMIEYALLAALISVVAIAVILLIGPYLVNVFQDVVNALGTP